MKNYQLFKLFFIFISIINLFFISIAYSQSPVPDIKINNSDGHIRFIPSEENVSVSVQLDAVGRTDNADWFLAVNTSQGLLFYTQKGWTKLIAPAVQTALSPLPKLNLMNYTASALPSGTYTLYFGVDTKMDGAITWEQLDFDAVEFTILESSLPKDSRFIEASAGGTLNVTNTRGDKISLTLPPGSLKESTHITMTALNSVVSSPLANNLLPGVVLSPQGLILEKPARIKVNFATPLTEVKSSSLFLVKDSTLALPLYNRDYSLNTLEADIYHFSTIDAAVIDSAAEIVNLINAIVAQSIDEVNWLNISENVRSLMETASIAQLSGWNNGSQKAWDEAQSIASAECAAFLTRPVPQEPCGAYHKSFLDRMVLAQLLGLNNCKNDNHYFSYNYIQDLFTSLGNQCDNKNIAGLWHFTPGSIIQQCTYYGVEIPDEYIDFPNYDLQISFPHSNNSKYIEAPVMKGHVMTGSWDGNSGKFDLSENTSVLSECRKLYDGYFDILCDDVINCKLVSCNITLELNNGQATMDNTGTILSLKADANWSFSVTTEVGYPEVRSKVPWVCEGTAVFNGSR